MDSVKIGDATLYHGDCMEILPTLPSESVDMIWTDPPYGHGNGDGDLLSRRAVAVGDGCKSTAVPIANDQPDTMRFVVDGMLNEASRLLKADCCCCCCCCCGGGGPSPTFAWLAQRMDRGGLMFFHSVIWDKKNPGMGWRYRRQHEMVMVSHRRGGRLSWREGEPATSNIVSLSKPRSDDHPNIKPVELVDGFIRRHTEDDGLVLDPFMGAGTTGVACANLGRKFIGIEIERKYFDIACERITAAYAQGRMFA